MSSKNGDKGVPDEHRRSSAGGWLPQDHRVHREWLGGVIDHVGQNPKDLVPEIREFKEAIETNTRLRLLFTTMFNQVPNKKPYQKEPSEQLKQVRDYDHMLQVLNHLITTAPGWNDKSHRTGMVGLPINALLDWPMATHSGFAVFFDPEVNAMIKKVLNAWGDYLKSPDSAAVLDDSDAGWFGKVGVKDLTETANVGGTSYNFEQLFHCDPSKKHHGFNSWDDFFTRLFRFDEGIRPVASPENDNVIANPCESEPYNVAYNVGRVEKFWLKGQPYSVLDMLAYDELSEQFVGGTVYQAFLSALSYHRWHSPVSGTVVKAFVKDGTYYSEPLWEDFSGNHNADEAGETDSQCYLTATATRAIIFIEADNPAIGLMCFLGIGMSEVSTCEITVKEGQHVKKGDQTGMFHFGGSTSCAVFRKGVDVSGFPQPGRKQNMPLCFPALPGGECPALGSMELELSALGSAIYEITEWTVPYGIETTEQEVYRKLHHHERPVVSNDNPARDIINHFACPSAKAAADALTIAFSPCGPGSALLSHDILPLAFNAGSLVETIEESAFVMLEPELGPPEEATPDLDDYPRTYEPDLEPEKKEDNDICGFYISKEDKKRGKKKTSRTVELEPESEPVQELELEPVPEESKEEDIWGLPVSKKAKDWKGKKKKLQKLEFELNPRNEGECRGTWRILEPEAVPQHEPLEEVVLEEICVWIYFTNSTRLCGVAGMSVA